MSDIQGHGSNLAAGNYKLEKFVVYSLIGNKTADLKNLFQRIEVYEDLFSPYVSAKLYMEDGVNLPESFPFVGHEKVELSFKTDVNAFSPVELVFRVYKLDAHKILPNGKVQQYVLHLMSEAGFFDYSQYCGYAMSGPVSEMVHGIFRKHFPENVWKNRLFVQPTKDRYSFVVSRAFTPLKAISWLSTKAHSESGDDYSPFMFYESLDGHRFRSLGSILELASANIPTYVYTVANIGVLGGERSSVGGYGVLPRRYEKIQKLEELSRFDAVSNIMNGMVSSRLAVHDLLRKQVRVTDLFEPNLFPKIKKLGTEPHFRQNDPESSRLFSQGAAYYYQPSTGYTVYSSNNQIADNFNIESLYLRRKYHINSFLAQKIAVEIFGDSSRRVGDTVRVRVPKPQADVTAKDDVEDKNLSGDYLVTAIRHTLATAYSCKMELSKNCMGV